MTGDDPINLGGHHHLAALNIDYTQPGFQTFDLASTPTAFHSLSIHGGDLDAVKTSMTAAIHNAKGDISDGIWDSGLHANSAIGIGKLTDAHGDPYVYIRSTRIGDLNLDGTVTIADFIDLAANFNGTGGWQEGDLNGDTLITISDFIDLAANFNASYLGSV